MLFGHLFDNKVLEHSGFLMFNLKENFAIFYHGYAGVIIFFLKSGYIIPTAISRCNNIKDFLIKRFIRIYPLFILVALYAMFRYDKFKIEMLLGFYFTHS